MAIKVVMMPRDTNPHGTIFGGVILSYIDQAGAVGEFAASGKRDSSYEIASAMALGANWCNVALGYMFSLGCIQSQSCHTNTCPVGVATQNQRLQLALVVEDKARCAATSTTLRCRGWQI